MMDEIEIINTKIINIMWEGPFSPEDAYEKNDESSDYGVYQCYYGDHPVYGLDVLLYIGTAPASPYGQKPYGQTLKSHKFEKWNQNIQIYLGRLYQKKEATPLTNNEWGEMMERVEMLLAHACSSAFNFEWIKTYPDADADEAKKLLILNWGNHRSLPAAVSGYRFIEGSLSDSYQPWNSRKRKKGS